MKKGGWIKNSFEEQMKIELGNSNSSNPHHVLKHGLYYESVRRYLDKFGDSFVRIIVFEELVNEPKKTLKNLIQFLNIDNDFENPDFIQNN